MKLTVCMKTPDALNYAIDEAIDSEIDDDSKGEIYAGDVKKLCDQWFKDGETVWLEIDTNEMTCNVMAL